MKFSMLECISSVFDKKEMNENGFIIINIICIFEHILVLLPLLLLQALKKILYKLKRSSNKRKYIISFKINIFLYYKTKK